MFRNRKYYNYVELGEVQRRLRRHLESNWNYRKVLLTLFVAAIVFLYIGPYIFSWLFNSSGTAKDPMSRCMDDRLTPFYPRTFEFNAQITRPTVPESTQRYFETHHPLIPYVGNGYFGVGVERNEPVHLKYGRHLSQPVNFHPIVEFESGADDYEGGSAEAKGSQASVIDFVNGVVHRFQCFGSEYSISSDFYAHRVIPQVLVQEVKFTNMRNTPVQLNVFPSGLGDWKNTQSKLIKIRQASSDKVIEFAVTTGTIELSKFGEPLYVTVISPRLPSRLLLKTRGISRLDILHVIHYSAPMFNKVKETPNTVEQAAIQTMTNLVQQHQFTFSENFDANVSAAKNQANPLRRPHTQVWNSLWETGFHISTSLAENVINGDQINSTIYAVLSQVRAFEFETDTSAAARADIYKLLMYAEGCYDSYHTLQAGDLWKEMTTIDDMNTVVMMWLLTLEKQGCHNLLKAGASGVLQAMVLSFGGFRFSNQHLELNIHPKYLHRDYFFRRLNYGNMSHINVSIEVSEDNRAMLYVALDRSDGRYYACDAGCLDEPIPLSQERKVFPVKLTDPLTAILYITADKEHIIELQHAIHVKEVAEAPAHEHHVIALHKHGHRLGNLPTFFWISIFAIIIFFHIFLCKLIIKEYCEPPEKLRYRYEKP